MSSSGTQPRQNIQPRSTPAVLVVEDNPVERMLLRQVLQNAGFEVNSLEFGSEVLDTALDWRPDLILLDAMLPDLDGFEVCRILQDHPRGRFIPVVMVTGLDDVASIDRAYEVGATDFITKPINQPLLVHRIRYLLRATSMMEELRLSRQSLASAQRVAKLGHWELHIEKQRVSFSEELGRLYRFDPAGAANYRVLLDACHPEDAPLLRQAIDNAIRTGESGRVEHRLSDPDGGERVLEMHLAMLADADGSRHLLGISMDVTARKESEREILRLAYFDRLTGLPNRSLLELILDQVIPRAHLNGGRVGLLTIDLDLFSRVNNALGHGAGDAVLRQVANRLSRLVAAPSPQNLLERLSLSMELGGDDWNGLVARLGADNFVVLCSDASGAALADLTAAARQLMQQPFMYRGQELFITASFGVASSDSAACPAETLLQHADMALRDAKEGGRDEVRAYHRSLVTQVSTKMSIQSDLRKALQRGEFQVYYQPRMEFSSGRVTGFEALIRWHHPQHGQVPPAQFITVAEETGQIVEIGRWVLRAACRQFRQWLDAGLVGGRIAVNISARQFRDPNLHDMVLEALRETGLPPKHLELEITEGVLMTDPRASETIAELRHHGISFALDDFGTGFCALSYLTRFSIDTLKIDRCFVHDISSDSDKAAIVTAVTSLSHRLSLRVVAEGVETEAELQVVGELQCDEVQGFLICRPLPAAEVTGWLQDLSAPVGLLRSVK